jgi:hypothetical protein
MSIFDSLFDSDLRAIKKSRSSIENAQRSLATGNIDSALESLERAKVMLYKGIPSKEENQAAYIETLSQLSQAYITCEKPDEANGLFYQGKSPIRHRV